MGSCTFGRSGFTPPSERDQVSGPRAERIKILVSELQREFNSAVCMGKGVRTVARPPIGRLELSGGGASEIERQMFALAEVSVMYQPNDYLR